MVSHTDLLGHKKNLLPETKTVSKFLLLRIKYIVDGGFLFDDCTYNYFIIPMREQSYSFIYYLTLKRLGGGGWEGSIWPRPCGFSKIVSSKEGVKPCFFVTFNIILKHIFPENFIDFPQVVQKIWRISLSILAIFINFPRYFGFFDITLLQRN